MHKTIGIPAAEWRAAKTEEQRAALIAKSRVPLTPQEIKQRQAEEKEALAAQAEAERMAYKEERRAEYPPIGDQLDAIMKWLATETEFAVPAELKSMAMKCMSVKAKYPKPTEE
jgi:hypothetical protein